MRDPLTSFDWISLDERYDQLCARFDGSVPHVDGFDPRPRSDRDLYRNLVQRVAVERTSGGITVGTYEGLLYWKFYSQPAAVWNVCRRLRRDATVRRRTSETLAVLSREFPASVPSDTTQVLDLVDRLHGYHLYGMAGSCALPVRTTFLHFLFPMTVPIFDKQVLKAVGVDAPRANQSREWLRAYLLHAWSLAHTYGARASHGRHESSIRLIDMALWVARAGGDSVRGGVRNRSAIRAGARHRPTAP